MTYTLEVFCYGRWEYEWQSADRAEIVKVKRGWSRTHRTRIVETVTVIDAALLAAEHARAQREADAERAADNDMFRRADERSGRMGR